MTTEIKPEARQKGSFARRMGYGLLTVAALLFIAMVSQGGENSTPAPLIIGALGLVLLVIGKTAQGK